MSAPGILLASTAAWTVYTQIQCEFSFTLIAATNALFYGLLMFIAGMKAGCGSTRQSAVKKIALLVLEVATLPLINVDLYQKEDNTLAHVHFLFIFPMIFDLIAQVFGQGSEESHTDYLKDLCCLANVASLMYLSHCNEDKWQYYALAGTILLGKLIEYFGVIIEGLGELVKPIVYPVFFGLLAFTLSENAA